MWILSFLWILIGFVLENEASFTAFHVEPNFGCFSGRKHGLLRHGDVSVCRGLWDGHVGNAGLCSNGWHVCNANDTDLLQTITFYEASHIDGCFAINAAHNDGICQDCSGDMDEMVGFGADCPRIDWQRSSCIGKGKIDASCCSQRHSHRSCGYRPWMTGVLCCKDKEIGIAPTIILSPVSSVQVAIGKKVTLSCKASGDPVPRITWYKNAHPVSTEELSSNVTIGDGEVVSKLVIPNIQAIKDGLYFCRAENSRGFAVSYTSDVTTYIPTADLTACRNKNKQRLFRGGDVAACRGKWAGSVKRAGKQLCAKGWRVCGLKDRGLLHRLAWEEVTSLAGCYAYDSATSDHFACTKCSHRLKGNSMSGIGGDCGMISVGEDSCLNKGRIDVWVGNKNNDEFNVGEAPKRRTCSYQKGVTAGVMCCKILKTKKHRIRRKGKTCSPLCAENSHCTRKGVCKCNSGFKALGNVCIARRRERQKCPRRECQNNGKCSTGRCVCRPGFSGFYCEKGSVLPWFHLVQRRALREWISQFENNYISPENLDALIQEMFWARKSPQSIASRLLKQSGQYHNKGWKTLSDTVYLK